MSISQGSNLVRRRVSLLGLAFMFGACSGEDSGLADRGVCDVLIECATQLAPETRDQYIATFGQGGSCWTDPRNWAACRDACRQTLDTLNLIAEATGASCGTCQSDADCSSFGIGAICANGYCLAGAPSGGEGASAEQAGDGDGDDGDPWDEIEAVTILMVIDNSLSMGPPQRVLAENAYQLVAPLEAAGVPWRLGITTTDNGNPWCTSGSEKGALVFAGCKSHIGDFYGNSGQTDHTGLACEDLCTLTNAEMQTNPTKTPSDSTPTSRPWLESYGDGTNNMSGDPSLAAVLACALPQGITGCGFESPLESANRAIARSNDPAEKQYGFVEPGRLLAVVFITDEADCSYNPQFDSIFETSGGKTFWSDPTAQYPTSAVCWNAGVECVGPASGYDSCNPADFDVDRDPTSDPDLAVLRPVQRYIDAFDSAGAVVTFGIVGVGANGQPSYANTDPEMQLFAGIDPACDVAGPYGQIEGLPPVRMWKVLQAFGPTGGEPAAYSICAPDFGGGLGQIGATLTSYF